MDDKKVKFESAFFFLKKLLFENVRKSGFLNRRKMSIFFIFFLKMILNAKL